MTRDLEEAQRFYDNYDRDLRGLLLRLVHPPWDGRGVRILNEHAVGALVDTDETASISCLSTVGTLYLDQVWCKARCESSASVFSWRSCISARGFHRRYLMVDAPSSQARTAVDDIEAVIPGWTQMVTPWHQIGIAMP